jgi:hypothetical protein
MLRLRHLLPLAVLAIACSKPDSASAPAEANVAEAHPGDLVLTSPARAAMIEDDGSAIEVSGSGASSALTVDGQAADVAADGTFHASIHPPPGLHVIVLQDGDSKLEAPILFGHFAKASDAVSKAIAIDVGPEGLAAKAPAASVSSVANLALADKDLVAALRGQTFKGSVAGADWTFAVTGGGNGAGTVQLGSTAKGLAVDTSIATITVDGKLSLKALGLSASRDVHVSVDRAHLTGDVMLNVDGTGKLGASMPAAPSVALEGFKFDTDNAGFFCCVDSILSDFIQPKIESTIQDAVKTEVPKLVSLSLGAVGIPKELDFSLAGNDLQIPLATKLDGATVDAAGATITASALFGGAYPDGSPGAKAPGSLALGKPLAAGARSGALGVSLSLDAVNQLMFAAWGGGTLGFDVPDPVNARLSPKLPPVVTIADGSTLRVGLGEVVMQKAGSDTPTAAITILQDVGASADQGTLVLTPKGDPTISITWLDGNDDSGASANLLAAAAKDQLARFLKPFKLPLPKIALDAVGPALAGKSLAIDAASVTFDDSTGRIAVSGAARIAP